MNISSIISGEAAETDSDEESPSPGSEQGKNIDNAKNLRTRKGEIITGEDSESDAEITLDTINTSVDTCATPEETKSVKNPVRVKKTYDSLLHRKLNESNLNLSRNLNGFFASQASTAAASLNNTDRELMKSQHTLQSALNSLRLLNAHSEAIKYTLKSVVIEDNYLHNLVPVIKK